MRLAKVLTVAEVAAIAGWQRKRMLRHLLRLDPIVFRETGFHLLRNVGTEERPRWTTTLAALRQAAPEWFTESDETMEARLEHLEDTVARYRRIIAAQERRIQALEAAAA